jgi:hypothetical protein
MKVDDDSTTGITKREFVKKATYVVPAVLSLAATPSFASAGSNSKKAKKPQNPYKNRRTSSKRKEQD